jgi:hypothetical protein
MMDEKGKAEIAQSTDLALSRLMSQATLIVGDDVEAARAYVAERLATVKVYFENMRSICSV